MAEKCLLVGLNTNPMIRIYILYIFIIHHPGIEPRSVRIRLLRELVAARRVREQRPLQRPRRDQYGQAGRVLCR